MLISSKNICIIHFAFLNAIAYKLLTHPEDVSRHVVVFMIGRAMEMSIADFSEDDPALGFVAFLLLFIGASDLAASMQQVPTYMELAAPFRLLLTFAVAIYAFFTNGDNEMIANSVVFAFCFLEMPIQFWLYITVREERAARIRVLEVTDDK
ncbi:increased loss of mitochondrial DNA protein 1 [Limtongia smithiae]|uniref:increased loss of mitochondrial DNA protein 1 n=1 Tax=Limtongia smithiae TaxID=1125753 RepID=UPI0034CF19A2